MKRASYLPLVLLAHLIAVPAAHGQEVPRATAATESCSVPRRVAQIMPADAHADFVRVAQLAGAAPRSSFLVRRGADARSAVVCNDGEVVAPWSRPSPGVRLPGGFRIDVVPLTSSTHYNSTYPRDRNNGALWAGRGLSTELKGGLSFRWGPLSGAFAPTLIYQQNRPFAIADSEIRPGLSPYVYRGHPGNIDWPRRPGDEAIRMVDPGQSHLRLDVFPIALGISTENLWWGPGRRNALIMSSNAPGFPHIFAGTSRPVNLWIGRFETELLWGRLEESDVFDDNPDNDRLLIASIVVGFEPRWFPGLYLGASRSYLQRLPPTGLPALRFWLIEPYKDVRDNPLTVEGADNQLLSVFLRWAPPGTGFEAYAEFGRDDHWADFDQLAAEPEVSGGYTLGFQQTFTRGERWWRIAGEVTQLGDPLPTVQRPNFRVYSHGRLPQGYTHRGRILGAAIGTASNSQFLGVDLFTPNGVRGLFIERVRWDADANRQLWNRRYGGDGADVEWSIGAQQRLFLRNFDLSAALTHSYRRNRDYIGLHASPAYFMAERNWNLHLELAWRPGR